MSVAPTRSKTPPELAARIHAAKARVRIADAWRALGLPNPPSETKSPARSPFREDRTPSLSIFDGGKAFCDHAHTEHAGDVIRFVELATGCQNHAAVETVLVWAGDTTPAWPIDDRKRKSSTPVAKAPLNLPERRPEEPPKPPPSLADVKPLTAAERRAIADSRGLTTSACDALSQVGQLFALRARDGTPWGWCLADGPEWPSPAPSGPRWPSSAYTAEARRLDRRPFRNGKKAWCLPGSKKNWPVGVSALAWPDRQWRVVLAVEGGPDLLVAHALLAHLGRSDVLPVAILSRETRNLHPAAAELLKGRHVHITPHNDPPHDGRDFRNGRAAAEAWARDLFFPAGAARVTVATLETLTRRDGHPVKDLCDAIEHGGIERNGAKLSNLIP